jgi:conjugal transfer pilus assembly protein TraB
MRNGKILTMAGISGMLSGFGNALAQGSQTQSISPLGATTTVSPSQVWQSGAYTGASTAMGQLASYYIKRADQYHPVIDIGSGTVATVIFQTGFSLLPKSSSDNQSQNIASNSNNSSNQTSGNDASEIKSLLKENQMLSQEKMQSQTQVADSNANSDTQSAPFSNVSQAKLGGVVSNG